MKNLLQYFPKEIATPKRIVVNDIQEFFKIYKKLQGNKNKLYYSLYNKTDLNKNYKYINFVAFDLDDKNRLKNIIKIHDILKKLNLKHCLIFSTKGFWVYILTKNYEQLEYPKYALTNAHDHFGELFGLKWGNSASADLDSAIRGDVNRVGRLIGSYDMKRKRYCISITGLDLKKGMKHIIEKSKSQIKTNIKINWYGEELFDISKFDSKITKYKDYRTKKERKELFVPRTEFEDLKNTSDELLSKFMPIIGYWLKTPESCIYQVRCYITNYFVNLELPDEMIDRIMFRYISKHPRTDSYRNNYNHWKRDNTLGKARQKEKDKNGWEVYKYSFPRIETLFEQGFIKSASYLDYVKYNEIYRNAYKLSEVKKYFEKVGDKNGIK